MYLPRFILLTLLFSMLGTASFVGAAQQHPTVPIPKYELTAIPSQKAFYGETLEFYVESGRPGPITVTVLSNVSGKLNLDGASNRFSYTPSTDDLRSFVTVFSCGNGADRIQRRVRISPLVRSANTFFPR